MTYRILTRFVVLVAAVTVARPVLAAEPLSFRYTLDQPGQVSSAVYDTEGRLIRTLLSGQSRPSGEHELSWDGLDRDGSPMPAGDYTWKVLRTPGFRADYVTSLGINPDSASWHRWVGNHGGAASISVDETGLYAAAQVTETAPVLLKQSLDGTKRHWTRSRGDVTKGRYQGGASLASDGQGRLLMLQQNGYLQVIDAAEGTLRDTWDVLPKDLKRKEDGGPTFFIYQHGERVAGADMDARGNTIVVSYRDDDRVRWIDPETGSALTEVEVREPTGVAVGNNGEVFVISRNRVLKITAEGERTTVIDSNLTAPRRLAVDPETEELLVAERSPGNQVKRFSSEGKLLAAYGRDGGRRQGVYNPEDFLGITDITTDGHGGFVVTELRPAPRRIVHCNGDGQVINEWYGGQPYYSWGEPDPRNPSHVWFNSGHWLTLAEVDYQSGRWNVLETWHLDTLADGLVQSLPGHHGRWWVVYHNDQRYLVSQGFPQVLIHKTGSLQPVSVIGTGSTLSEFVEARELALSEKTTHASNVALADASSFRWIDTNHDGRPQSSEFTLTRSRDTPRGNWVAEDFAVLQTGNADAEDGTQFVVMETRPEWKDGIPVYPIGDERGVKLPVGGMEIEGRAGSRGSGAYRDSRGNYFGNVNAGRERHGAGWPTLWGGVSRLIKWDPDGNLRWSVGRHAIHGGLGKAPGSTPPGRLHVPVNVIGEADNTVVLADRVETTAMAWTQDGLYAGSFFDHRTDDDLPGTVYHWWRAPDGTEAITTSDNAEGGRVIQRGDGAVFWLAQGRNSVPVYRIYGWKDWTKLEGTLTLTKEPRHAAGQGSGLRARYYPARNGQPGKTSDDALVEAEALTRTAAWMTGSPAIDRVDSQVWHGSPRKSPGNDPVFDGFRFGPAYDWSDGVEGLETSNGFAVRWSGQVEAALSEPFTFSVYARGGVRLWIDGRQRIFGWNESTSRWESEPIALQAGKRYSVQLDFYTTHEHPACSLNWESPGLDRRRIPTKFLYPERMSEIAPVPDARQATEYIDAITFTNQSGEISPKDVRGSLRGLRQRAIGKTGAWVEYRRIDFGKGRSTVHLDATGTPAGRGDYPVTLTLRLDSPDGPSIGTVSLTENGPAEQPTRLSKTVSGVHDLYIVNTTEKNWHFIRLHGFRFE